jgi:hypothetical protein
VVCTWNWPLVGDAALIHYVVFLVDHGFAPYRDIVDPNMPSTFLIQGAVIHAFGWDSLTWRLFDFFLLAITGIAMVVVSKPYDWFAGFFAAALFALIHGRDGVIQLGQRDLEMTVFLIVGYAFLFEGLRVLPSERTKPWTTAVFGFCCGVAATIKPSVLFLAPCLLLMLAVTLRARGKPFRSHVAFGIMGTLTPVLMILGYVIHKHILSAFLGTLFNLIPFFVHLGARSIGHLVLHSVSAVLLPLVLTWLLVVSMMNRWLTWERAALLTGVLFGLASFYIQRKGFPYHRYPSEAFFLLLIAIDFTTVLRSSRDGQRPLLYRLALTGVLIGVLVVGAGSTVHALRQDGKNREFEALLQADLMRFGGSSLDNHVQCLDMADGCIPTLYDMKLVQATGFLYDCYMFSPIDGAERTRYREAFWAAIKKNPPTIFVVSSNDCEIYPDKPSYDFKKLSRWARLDDYLHANYHFAVQRIPPHMVNWGSSPSKPLGYRIYLRNQP